MSTFSTLSDARFPDEPQFAVDHGTSLVRIGFTLYHTNRPQLPQVKDTAHRPVRFSTTLESTLEPSLQVPLGGFNLSHIRTISCEYPCLFLAQLPGPSAARAGGERTIPLCSQQAARVSDLTGFFCHGRLVEAGPTDQLYTCPRMKQTEDYITGRFG
jgi:hypothetical protein